MIPRLNLIPKPVKSQLTGDEIDEILEEFRLIQEKKSSLSLSERQKTIYMVMQLKNQGLVIQGE